VRKPVFHCSSSGIALFGMRTVQADSCLNSEPIDFLFIIVGGQEGGFGGGHFGPKAQNLHVTVINILCRGGRRRTEKGVFLKCSQCMRTTAGSLKLSIQR